MINIGDRPGFGHLWFTASPLRPLMSFYIQLRLIYEVLFIAWSNSDFESRLNCASFYISSMHCCAYTFFFLFLQNVEASGERTEDRDESDHENSS